MVVYLPLVDVSIYSYLLRVYDFLLYDLPFRICRDTTFYDESLNSPKFLSLINDKRLPTHHYIREIYFLQRTKTVTLEKFIKEDLKPLLVPIKF